ncbi:hypothetical protein TUM22923_18350 [Polynucleobacter sp. TUM22923]|nr:hypothetical protein TUM22923_18350 [Polynucleobacter sp. TUM22923]
MLMSAVKPSQFPYASLVTLSGMVGKLDNSVLEYVNPEKPTHDHSSVYYKRFFVSKFELNEHLIEAQFSSPMAIQNGDVVRVVGQTKDRTLQVLAYINETQQTQHSENWAVLILGAIFFLAVAIGLLNSELVLEGAVIPRLFLIGFCIVALYMGYRAFLIREAVKLLQG